VQDEEIADARTAYEAHQQYPRQGDGTFLNEAHREQGRRPPRRTERQLEALMGSPICTKGTTGMVTGIGDIAIGPA